jgi:hypothetical protein
MQENDDDVHGIRKQLIVMKDKILSTEVARNELKGSNESGVA